MINMMRADLYRIFRGFGIYIAAALVIIMSFISTVMQEPGYLGTATVGYNGEELTDIRDVDFEEYRTAQTAEEKKTLTRKIIATNSNLYYPLIILVFVFLMADFSNHTMKNTLTTATSKKKYYIYKLFMTLLSSAALIFFNTLFTYLLNYIMNGKEYTEPLGALLKTTALQLPMLLGAVSLLIMLGFLTKKAAAFNAVAISFVILFQLIVNVVYTLTKWESVENFIYRYELQAALGRLAFSPEGKYALTCMGIGLAEIAISSLLGYQIFKKSEIK